MLNTTKRSPRHKRSSLGSVQSRSSVNFPPSSPDLLPACNGEAATLSFLQDVVDILLQYVVKSFDRSTKVIDFHYPNELLQEYNWELAEQPQTLEEILLNCRTTLKYAIKTGTAALMEVVSRCVPQCYKSEQPWSSAISRQFLTEQGLFPALGLSVQHRSPLVI